MLNPNNLEVLITDITDKMKVKNYTSYEILLKVAFLDRSNLEQIFNFDDGMRKLHSFMMFDVTELRNIHENIKYNTFISKNILDITGIDILEMDAKFFIKEMDYNIAFMVCVSLSYFIIFHLDVPEPNSKKIIEFYCKHFRHNNSTEKLVEKYNDVFNKHK